MALCKSTVCFTYVTPVSLSHNSLRRQNNHSSLLHIQFASTVVGKAPLFHAILNDSSLRQLRCHPPLSPTFMLKFEGPEGGGKTQGISRSCDEDSDPLELSDRRLGRRSL